MRPAATSVSTLPLHCTMVLLPTLRNVGSKTREQCKHKVATEVAAGRMQEPGGKQIQDSWRKVELLRLMKTVDLHGRDWIAVATSAARP